MAREHERERETEKWAPRTDAKARGGIARIRIRRPVAFLQPLPTAVANFLRPLLFIVSQKHTKTKIPVDVPV